MAIEIRDSSLLKLKLSRADNERQPVSFLLGAPFSLDRGVGVPGIEGFIEVIRERVAHSGKALLDELDNELGAASDADRYQTAMAFVYDALDARAAADIVKTAVLRARKPDAPPLAPAEDRDGVARDWQITRAQRGLALAMKLAPDRYPGPVFTTNFDPMISLALIDLGFDVKAVGLPLEGSISASVKLRKSEVDVFHLHGYWRDSATLHRPQQLLASRPQLQQSLQRHLDGTHLIVMAYSGWDDIFTTAIASCLSDPGFRGTVSWCFYKEDPVVVEAENKALFGKFAAGIAQGNISFFCGIDCHTFFNELIGTLGFTPADRAAVEASPIPGWRIVTQEALDAEPPLTGIEAVRFFDGAVPTLRHAISPLVPRLSHADALISRLGEVADGVGMQLLLAAGGEGKSTALLQTAAAAAQIGQWTVLYRPAPDAGLNSDVLAQLDPGRKWLVVADDAEELINDIWSAAGKLHREGRRTVFFLLAARDTDWRANGGEAKGWTTRLKKLDDVTLGRIAPADAGLVVDAWAAQGDEGLRALNKLTTRETRVQGLLEAARAEEIRSAEGSFFGGLLDIRFGATGLVEHLLPLLEALRDRPIEGGTASLFDALVYVANCHATGMPGLDNRVLGPLCSIPVFRVPSAIVAPLGKEVGAAESRGHVLTRHKKVAEAVVIAAVRLGADLNTVWHRLVKQTVELSKRERVGETFSLIVHAGARLNADLPQALNARLRGEISISAAEAAVAALPNRATTVTVLARALRFAGYSKDAYDLLLQRSSDLKNMVDRAETVRGYFTEWSTCAGNLGHRQGSVIDAWLAACSLSDSLPVDLPLERAKLSCAGLGVAFKHLSDGKPNGIYSKGRRAVTALGWLTRPDERAAAYFARYQEELDAVGAPKPRDNDEALAWLADAAFAAWQELEDPYLRRLKGDGRLTFQRLRKALTGSPPA